MSIPTKPTGSNDPHGTIVFGIDAAGDFVSGHTRILKAGPETFFYEGIAVADPAGFDFDADLVASGLGNVSFDEFEIAAGLGNLDGFHFWHDGFLISVE